MSAVLIAVMLLTSMLAACSSNNNNSSSGNASPTGEAGTNDSGSALEHYDLTLALPVFGAVPKDLEKVQDEANKITEEEINTTVTILPIGIGTYSQQMNLMTSSREKLDLYFNFGQGYSQLVATGSFSELDDLLDKYGQGIIEQVGKDNIEAARVNGKIYGVPVTGVNGKMGGIVMRKDLVDKYQIDTTAIHSMADLAGVFQKIKENEPGMSPLGVGLSAPLEFQRTYDRLGDGIGVLPGFDNGLKVVNYYETEEYADLLHLMRDWFQKGYINKDAATTQVNEYELVKAGKAFSYMTAVEPGSAEAIAQTTGYDMVVINLLPQPSTTSTDVLTGLYAIAQHSKNPERAMMLLNLMYTNTDLANLLTWGIEGEHYNKVNETQANYPEGMNSGTVAYHIDAWLLGNPLITFVPAWFNADHWEQVKTWNASARKSKALGFLFDQQPVKNEFTALNNVREQYKRALETGTVDPAEKLDEFNKKLKAAGLDKYIAEKQKQLDEWAASKKQ